MRKEKTTARPLTKRRKLTGDLYARLEHVETQINEIITQDLATIKPRLAVVDYQTPGYLYSECLVHLIRDARRNSADAILNAILPVLLGRCKAILLTKIPDNALRTAVDVREEVLGQFSELFATDGTEENRDNLDFFECHFNQAFFTFYTDLVRSEKARLKPLVFPSDRADYVEYSPTHREIPTRLIEALRSRDTAESSVLLREIYEAINTLPYDERKAVILCHVMEYKIESNNPDEVTAATRCNVSGRTIRNRLSRAAEKLSHLGKET